MQSASTTCTAGSNSLPVAAWWAGSVISVSTTTASVVTPERLHAECPVLRPPQSEAYQKALVVLADGVERDFRIIEGID